MSGRVLIFSEPFGLGHERAAQALIKGIRTLNPQAETLHTNSIKSSFPELSKPFTRLYLQLINKFPLTWHRLYENGRRSTDNQRLKSIVHRLLSGSIRKVLEEFQPQTVVCTHPFPAAVICRLKEQGLKVPLVGIITDYDVHSYWLDKNVDLYVVGDDSLREGFTDLNFVPRLVSGEGIPIDPVFGAKTDKIKAKKNLGLDHNLPVILVGGGGWGLGNQSKIVEMLSKMPESVQVVVLTGINASLKQVLERNYKDSKTVRVEGFVHNIHEYMSAADVMVTKPGGLSTSEGLAMGLPMVLFDVLYGQEVWNARFLAENGAALKCGLVEEIPVHVRRLINNGADHSEIGRRAQLLGKPTAGIQAAKRILQLAT